MEVTEAQITEKVNLHLKKVEETVKGFESVLSGLKKNDENFKASLKKVMGLEDEADELRIEILDMLARAHIDPALEHDLSEFVGLVDNIADKTKDACRILTTADFSRGYPDDAYSQLAQIGVTLSDIAGHLTQTMLLLETDRQKAKEHITEVEKGEHFIDGLYVNLFGKITNSKYPSPNDALKAVAFREVATFCEETADSVEGASDILKIVISKMEG